MKFCMRVRLLRGQVFSHFDELWLAWNHGGGITSGMYASTQCSYATAPGLRALARLGAQSELGAAASRKAVWWNLRLASLLMHLYTSLFTKQQNKENKQVQ